MTVLADLHFDAQSKCIKYTCESLSNLCVDVITKNFSRHTREMHYLPATIKNKLFQIACRRCKVLEDVDVLSSLLHPNIREIDFTNCNVTTEMIETISHCHNVEKLHMICNSSVSKDALIVLVSGLPNLKVLRAKNCPCIDDEFIEILVKHCTLLKILDIARCNITEASLQNIGRLKLTALNIANVLISDKGMNNLLSGECKHTLRELIVCCSRTYGHTIEDDLPNLTIFVNKSCITLENTRNLKQLSWVVNMANS